MRLLADQDGSRGSGTVGALAKYFALAALVAALFGIGRSAWMKWDVSRSGERYMVVSSRSASEDLFYRELATQTAVFRYTRADSALGTELRRQMPYEGRLAVYTERGGRTVSVSTSVGDISRAADIGNRSIEAQSLPAVFIGVVAGAALGMSLGPSFWVLIAGLTVAACAAVHKLVAGCPTCAPSSLWGVRVEVLGAGALTAISIGLAVGVLGPGIVALLMAFTAAGQVVVTLATGTDCPACAVVAGGCALTSFSFLGRASAAIRPRRWAAAAVPVIVASFWMVTPRPDPHRTTDMLRTPTTWLGKDLKELGSIELPKSGRRLVIVWSRGCRPCSFALERLALEPELNADLYLGVPPGESSRARGERYIELNGRLDQTPAFFVIDSSGTVRSEYKGWATDPEWANQFVATLRHDLEAQD
ncbi:MAG: hypothetical protein AB7F50_04990 [Fimbriimonadaceae bacterium]